jgi:hypothetical protein
LDESYDNVISRLIDVAKSPCAPELGRKAAERIKHARKRIKAGKFMDEKEAKKRLES